MSSIKNKIGRYGVILLYYTFRIFPVRKNKVFVKNFFGRGYGDSPKYIIEYLLENHPGYDIVWCVNSNYAFPKGVRTVNISTMLGLARSIYEQVTAKIWIDNSRKQSFERKRKGQYYIQTWHGDMGIKKAQGDAIEKMPLNEINSAKHDSQMADLFVCGNEWMCQRYREAYWYNGEIATCGLPRRDIQLVAEQSKKACIRADLGIKETTHALLYVPTFRKEDIFGDGLASYAASFDWASVLKSLEEKFGGEWIGLMRLHPNAAKYSKDLSLPSNVINVTSYPDINELYCISDCCISDYSSSLFEFAVTKKPGFIYATDIDQYEKERGLYFTNEQLPFSVATSMDELVTNIKDYNETEYLCRHKMFYQDTIHMYPEGHASEYIAKIIVQVCGLNHIDIKSI